MQGIKISKPRILRSLNDQPLTLEQIRGVSPAVFQTQPWGAMSSSYAYIPTIVVLEVLLAQGYTVHEVAQARPYRTERDPYAKHMLRLRYPKQKNKAKDFAPEIVLINAHDGTARYYLYVGIYRFLCSNGLVVGDTFAKIVVRHSGGDITKHKVLEGSAELVHAEVPKVVDSVARMQARQLTQNERIGLAQTALELRYGGQATTVLPADVLVPRRPEDAGHDLWTVMNVIQEHTIQGGFGSRSLMLGRAHTARPIERVNQLVKVNRGLWDNAMGML